MTIQQKSKKSIINKISDKIYDLYEDNEMGFGVNVVLIILFIISLVVPLHWYNLLAILIIFNIMEYVRIKYRLG